MAKFAVNGEEWYPVHVIFPSEHAGIEIPPSVVRRYNIAKEAHREALKEIDRFVDAVPVDELAKACEELGIEYVKATQ